MEFIVFLLAGFIMTANANPAIQPSIEVDSVHGKTWGSQIYPFACYEYPTLSTQPKKTWPAKTQRKVELNCWSRPIQSWQGAKAHNISWQFSQFDNDIFWFHSQAEACWFPDYTVQKDAVYGPQVGLFGMPNSVSSAAQSKSCRGAATLLNQAVVSGTKAPQPFPTAVTHGNGFPGKFPGPGKVPSLGWLWELQAMFPKSGLKEADDLKAKLRYCPQPSFQAATFRPQYSGQTYCYAQTKLESTSRKVQLNPAKLAELSCWKLGAVVDEDPLWWKLSSEDCYLPSQVFEPTSFQGNAGECKEQ